MKYIWISSLLLVLILVSCNDNNQSAQQNQSEEQAENNVNDSVSNSVQNESQVYDNDSVGPDTVQEQVMDSKTDSEEDPVQSNTETSTPEVEEEPVDETIIKEEPPTEEVTKEVEEERPTNKGVVESPFHYHQDFNRMLVKYVSSDGTVNYKGFKTEQKTLKSYIGSLNMISPNVNWSREQKLAYWINLYNASTINLILDNYPLTSITKLDKPWDTKFVHSGNKVYTLNEIENEIIRPVFKEPRIHFAVNCAAKSCPKLLNEAYIWSRLDEQLDRSTRYFVNNAGKNKLTQKAIVVSKIFEWYGDDFGGKTGLIPFLNKYSKIKISSDAQIGYLEYNWELNN